MRYISLVLLLGIPFFLVLYVILPDFTALLLGDEWRMSGEYIRLMLPWLLAYSVADVLDFLPQLFKKQEGLLVVEIIDLALKLAVLALGIHSNNFYLALLLYFAVCFVVNAGKAIWLMVLARNYEKGKLSC
jgi:O-antigen/teichoic acid export membrane protein